MPTERKTTKGGAALSGRAPATRLALSREEAAEALGISLRKFDELVANCDSGLPVVHIGRKPVFPVGPLTAWLTERVGLVV